MVYSNSDLIKGKRRKEGGERGKGLGDGRKEEGNCEGIKGKNVKCPNFKECNIL